MRPEAQPSRERPGSGFYKATEALLQRWFPASRFSRLTIAGRLAAIVLTLAVPLNLVIFAVVWRLADAASETQRASLLYNARSIAAAVDAELEKYMALGQALARSPALLEEDLGAFEAEARRTFPSISAAWIAVYDVEGQQILTVARQPDRLLPPRSEVGFAAQQRAFESRSPVVTDVFIGRLVKDWLVDIDVPIFRDDQPFRELSVSIKARDFLRLLNDRQIPKNWLAGIMDSRGHFIARVPDHDGTVGQLAAEGWWKIKDQEGLFEFLSRDGDPIVHANAHSKIAGWPVAVAVKKAELQAAAWSTIQWATILGGGLSILSLLFAGAMARRITGPIAELRQKATSLLIDPSLPAPPGPPEIVELGQALKQSAAHRNRIDEALRESEERLAAALRAGKLGVYDYDPRTGIIKWDQTVYRLFGVPEGELITYETFEAGVHPDDRAAVRAAASQASDPGGSHHYECEYRAISRAGGTVRWIFAEGDVTFDADGPCRLVGTVQDITERKLARESLRQSEARYRMIHESLRDAFVQVSIDGRIVECNDLYCEMLGYSREELHALTYQDLTPPRWHAFEEDIVRNQIIERGHSDVYEKEYRRKDGVVIPVELRAMLSRDGSGQPKAMWAIVRDITGRKKAEEERLSSRAKLEAAMASMSDAVFISDAEGNYTHFNEAFATFYKFPSKAECATTFSEFPSLLDVLTANGEVAPLEQWVVPRALRGETGVGAEYTLRRKDTGETWVGSYNFSPIRNQEGKISGAVVTMRDITDHKRAAEALREREERLRAIVETAVDAIVVIDEDGLIQSINPATERIFGYRPGELCGKNVSILMPERDGAVHDKFISAYLLTGKAKIIGIGREVDHRRKDGSVFTADLAVAEWHVGGKRYFTGTIRDITERKRHEEEVHLLLREVNHRAKNMLGLVQAIARQTVAAKPGEFLERFEERVQALAASQDLLVKNEWKGVDLDELIRSQLAHFKDVIGTSIELEGPSLFISASAAQTIGMALHELATNAGKYGALSTQEGRIEIAWRLERRENDEEAFAISWREHGGPPVMTPAKSGFGSTVTGPMAEMSLDAKIGLDFGSDGLSWLLRCPAAKVLEGRLPPAVAENIEPGFSATRSSTRPRILIVEDEALIAMEIAQVLADAGFDVVGPAGGAGQALELLAHTECDAAVLDINLGSETSEPVARELNAAGTPFVTLSGYCREQHPSIFHGTPALAKPLRPELLVTELRRRLKQDEK